MRLTKEQAKSLKASCLEVEAILLAAFEEDEREGGRFDAIGFEQFCPEDKPEHIREAWGIYNDCYVMAHSRASRGAV